MRMRSPTWGVQGVRYRVFASRPVRQEKRVAAVLRSRDEEKDALYEFRQFFTSIELKSIKSDPSLRIWHPNLKSPRFFIFEIPL